MLMGDYQRQRKTVGPIARPRRTPRSGRIGVAAAILLALLLACPVYALTRLSIQVDWRLLIAAPATVSLFTYLAYRHDKRCAENGGWRVSEATLHFCELIGGWPGAYLAQRMYRHKTAKVSYQITFWGIVALHQFAAIDSLIAWRFTKMVFQHLPR